MHIDYPARISETLEVLEHRERELRGKRPVERVRMLPLLKNRQATTLQHCANLLTAIAKSLVGGPNISRKVSTICWVWPLHMDDEVA